MKKKFGKQCRKCLRLFKIGGCAMTKWNCSICNKEQLAGSTAHSKICNDCAIKENRCYWCGELHEIAKVA